MKQNSQQAVPFVFQVSSALREFMMAHSGERTVDLCIGTPPTSAAIRAKQMELIFGTDENPFIEGSAEYSFFEECSQMVFNMGKYEVTGGRMELKDFFSSQLQEGEILTIISGGETKARELIALVKEENLVPERDSVFDAVRIVTDSLLERCALAVVMGPAEMVKKIESLHTCILGTPSAPQEDLYLLLRNESFRNYVENPQNEDDDSEHCLREIFEFISLLYHEPISSVVEQAKKLKLKFSHNFLHCFFPKISRPAYIVSGNGGGRQALHIIEKTLVEDGLQNMILFAPHWTYSNVFRNTKIITLASAASGEPDMEILEKTLQELAQESGCAEGPGKGDNTIHTALTINSPQNPSGVVYSKEILEQLLLLAQKYNAYVIDDGCYIGITRQSQTYPTLLETALHMVEHSTLRQEFLSNIFVAMTASKGLGMAGGRLGAVVFFDERLQTNINEYYSTEFPNLMSFFLAQKLSEDPFAFMDLLKTINKEVDKRVETVTNFLEELGLEYRWPAGAFYLEIKTPFLQKSVNDMKQFALQMAREKGVAFMPMEVFGGDRYSIRLSLGGEKSFEQLEEEMKILVSQLRKFSL